MHFYDGPKRGLLRTVWLLALPSYFPVLSEFCLYHWGKRTDLNETGASAAPLIAYVWAFGTVGLWGFAILTSLVCLICLLVLIASPVPPPRARWSGLVAVLLAWLPIVVLAVRLRK
jgi:hypothetical protein